MDKVGELLGTGRTAKVYNYEENKVIKIFDDFWSDELIDQEFRVGITVSQHDMKTPKPLKKIEVEGKRGIIYEKVKGISLADALTKYHKKARHLGQDAGLLHSSINKIETQEFPAEKDVFKYRLKQVEDLDKEIIDKICHYIDQLPDGQYLCHGDLHVENYMYNEEEKTLYAIDWMSGYSGHPAGDIARTMLVMKSPVITGGLNFLQKRLISKVLKTYNQAYYNAYVEEAEFEEALIDTYLLPIAAIRLTEHIPYEKDWLLEKINREMIRLGLD